jgi:hypothetical protein
VEDGSGGQAVGSKAGAWVVDFEDLDGGSGAVFDRGVNVIGVAGGEEEKD